jgi:hypothetical protein
VEKRREFQSSNVAVNHNSERPVPLSLELREVNFSHSYLPRVSDFQPELLEDPNITVTLSPDCDPVLVAGLVDSVRGLVTRAQELLDSGSNLIEGFLENPVVSTVRRTAGTALNIIQDTPELVSDMIAHPRRTIREVRDLIEQGMQAPGETARDVFTNLARYVVSNTPGLDPRTSERIRNNGRFRHLNNGDIILEVPGSDIIVNVPDTRFPGRSFELGIRRANGRIEWSPDGGTVQRYNGRDVIVTPDRRRLLASDGWRVPLANGQWGPSIPNGIPAELTVGDSRNFGIIERRQDGSTIFHQTDHTFRLQNRGEGYSQPWSSTNYRPTILGGELHSQHIETGTLIRANRDNTGTIRFRNSDLSYSSAIEGTFVLNRLQSGETLPGVKTSWNDIELIYLPDGRIRFVGSNGLSQPFFAQPVTIPSISGTSEISGLQVAFDNDKFFVGNGGVRMILPDGTYSKPVSGTLTVLDGAMYIDLDSPFLTSGQRVLVRPGGEGPSIRISSVPDANGNRHWGPNIDGQLILINGQPALQSKSVPDVAMIVNGDGSIGWSLKSFSDDGRVEWSPTFRGSVSLWNERVVIDAGRFIITGSQVYDKERNQFVPIEEVTRINLSSETTLESYRNIVARGWLLGRLQGQTVENTSFSPELIPQALRHIPLLEYSSSLTPGERAAYEISRLSAGVIYNTILSLRVRRLPITTIADLTISLALVPKEVYELEIGDPLEIFTAELLSNTTSPFTQKFGSLEPIVTSKMDINVNFLNLFETRTPARIQQNPISNPASPVIPKPIP